LGLLDPAEDVLPGDPAVHVRVIAAHMRHDGVDDLLVGVAARHIAALAIDQLRHRGPPSAAQSVPRHPWLDGGGILESPGIRAHLCGRVAIDLGGRRVEHSLPGRQGRLLFVYLAIHRLRAVTRDELAEAVWPDGPPTAWDSALNARLSKLRRLLGADLVPARGDPRLVLPTAAWVDLEAARDAVHRAESAVALEDWPRAWGAAQATMFTAGGGFLPGGGVTWAEEIRRQLAELYLRALEAYALAALGLGGPELATAERA